MRNGINSLGIGAFVDVNFIRNKAPNTVIPGIEVSGGYASASTGGVGSSGYELNGNLFLKAFVFSPQSTAIKFDVGYDRSSLSGNNITTTINGFASELALQFYF